MHKQAILYMPNAAINDLLMGGALALALAPTRNIDIAVPKAIVAYLK